MVKLKKKHIRNCYTNKNIEKLQEKINGNVN